MDPGGKIKMWRRAAGRQKNYRFYERKTFLCEKGSLSFTAFVLNFTERDETIHFKLNTIVIYASRIWELTVIKSM